MNLNTVHFLEDYENRLSPLAVKTAQSKGRKIKEDAAEHRTMFQRDRDRILHCAAFRRMEYKTQVFVNHEGDHYRTRLTHSLEVAQIGRTVGRALKLNEDLIEALVLAHDLGHTPFGHAGEDMMAKLMLEHGGFEHNSQSLRIVDVLEHRYPTFRGLNLCFEVREGIVKHSANWQKEKIPTELLPEEYPSLEAQLIDYVDEIAYNNHDIDDGLASNMIDIDDLRSVDLWQMAEKRAQQKYPNVSWPNNKYVCISSMMSILVSDLIEQTQTMIQKSGVQCYQDIRVHSEALAGFSSEIYEKNQKLKIFLRDKLYSHYRVVRMEEKAKRIISDLFNSFIQRPGQIPSDFINQHPEPKNTARVICDYIAGMTDRFATREHVKLFNPQAKV
ncbi:MAG TPA: deoxyguanosinetriphosphate triphosphohydrolase [Oligoflexia bacterium]|nr:deoxyguanosinetriphosphate triphosphohydrolase [Oligoflexia bacterium]HMR23926.1 deoxyguanosinetriphosphate triphosphohydrolase [Oligoflexia bacterium]